MSVINELTKTGDSWLVWAFSAEFIVSHPGFRMRNESTRFALRRDVRRPGRSRPGLGSFSLNRHDQLPLADDWRHELNLRSHPKVGVVFDGVYGCPDRNDIGMVRIVDQLPLFQTMAPLGVL